MYSHGRLTTTPNVTRIPNLLALTHSSDFALQPGPRVSSGGARVEHAPGAEFNGLGWSEKMDPMEQWNTLATDDYTSGTQINFQIQSKSIRIQMQIEKHLDLLSCLNR